MNKKYKAACLIVFLLGLIVLAIWYLHGANIAVLNPKGPVARKERDLIYIALALSLIVVIPVFVLTYGFAWHYREGNKKAKYSPSLKGNRFIETIWWLVPTAIITVLAVITWNSTHQLDPYKPLSSSNKPINIQVVALDWKWLFIYPQQNVASVNYFQFPKDTPLNFEITSDAPMNSFWIPQLGGQIYAMPGMSTQLHLMATSYGSFNGLSANISGKGFSGMTFVARSTSVSSFDNWVSNVKNSGQGLSTSKYAKLAEPSEYNKPSYYSSVNDNLYVKIIDKYMTPGGQMEGYGGSTQTGSSTTIQGMEMQ